MPILSDRLVEFQLGILGLTLGTIIQQILSKSHAAANKVVFSCALDWGLRLVGLIGLSSTIGLAAGVIAVGLYDFVDLAWWNDWALRCAYLI